MRPYAGLSGVAQLPMSSALLTAFAPAPVPLPAAPDRAARLLSRLQQRWGPQSHRHTRPGVTRLCIDGPPRSANSLLCRKLALAAQGTAAGTWAGRALAHHTHDADSVLLAVLLEVPVIMPVRDPRDALASLAVYAGQRGMVRACQQYQALLQVALSHPARVLPASFDAIVHDANRVFRAAGERFGLALPALPIPDADANALIGARVKEARHHGEHAARRAGLPDPARETAKQHARNMLASLPEMDRCLDLHRRLVARGVV